MRAARRAAGCLGSLGSLGVLLALLALRAQVGAAAGHQRGRLPVGLGFCGFLGGKASRPRASGSGGAAAKFAAGAARLRSPGGEAALGASLRLRVLLLPLLFLHFFFIFYFFAFSNQC